MLRTFALAAAAALFITPAFAQKPPKEMANLQAGIAAYEAKDYATAVEKLTAAIDSKKLKGDAKRTAHLVRGVSYVGLTQCGNAVPDFNVAIEMQEEAQVFAQRGNCYVELQQLPQGLADLKKASELEPTNQAYAEFYCASAFNAKVYAEAGPACEKAVKTFAPQNAELIQATAQSYEQAGDKPKANEMWKMLLALDPKSEAAKQGIARTS